MEDGSTEERVDKSLVQNDRVGIGLWRIASIGVCELEYPIVNEML